MEPSTRPMHAPGTEVARPNRAESRIHQTRALAKLALACSLAWGPLPPRAAAEVEAVADGIPASERAPVELDRGAEARHGISVFGDLAYPPDFAHFGYVRPDAPKGGELRIPGFGTFDSLNGFIRKGRSATGVDSQRNFIYDTLAEPAEDEPRAYYGRLARTIALAPDRSFVEFELRPEARWHDGRPITADDVVFTFATLRESGSPTIRVLLRKLGRVVARGPHTVRFELLDPDDRRLPLTLSTQAILPRHYWERRDFERTTLEPPLGSGPYRIQEVDPGRRIVFSRVPGYWGRDLPVNVGRHNFDRIQVEYFSDTDVRLEALKGGVIDFASESVSKTWVEGYDFPARRRGDVQLEVVRTESPAIVRAILFNTRLAKFQDARVRKALVYAFDREWKNRVQTHGVYEPGDSYFPSSDLAHRGPPSEAERALLEPFRDQLPPEVFEREFRVPRTKGVGRNRENLAESLRLLREAGYEVRDGVLVSSETGKPFTVDMLLDSAARIRMSLLYADALRRLGIETTMRVVDSSQLLNRRRAFDFELMYGYYRVDNVPGNELVAYFSSEGAASPNSRNYAGIAHPAVDALIQTITQARSYDELVTACRALDRVLLWNYYMIDLGYAPGAHYAYWNRFGKPEENPRFATGFPDTWWYDAERAARIGTGADEVAH